MVSLGNSVSFDSVPQFGEPVAGVSYIDRPGVYALVVRDNRLLVIETPAGYFLPGGGTDTHEAPEDALRRELREEAGLSAMDLTEVGMARQYVIESSTGIGYNKIETYVRAVAVHPCSDPVELDHTPRWIPVSEAITRLREPAQAWAVRTLLSS
jgi:8-oxo-dGTP diphosphatase